MKLGRVRAQVVSTRKHPAYRGLTTLLVEVLDREDKGTGQTFVAVDRARAGIGDTVLLMQEGSSARAMLKNDEAPVRSVIVGIVDSVDRKEGAG